MNERVVVTGMGVVSPLGCSVDRFRDRLIAGESGVGPITLFDPGALRTRIAAQVPENFAPALRDRKIAFALEAARQAIQQASACGSAPGGELRGAGAGLSLGIGLELFAMEDLVAMRRPGFRPPQSAAERMVFLQTPSDICLHLVSRRYGLTAPPLTHTSACASGTDAIGVGARMVATGRRRWVLAGGTDSMINPLGVGGFCKLSATSAANDSPRQASRPFDRARDGFVLGEGAGIVVLETLSAARLRGVPILAEIAGYGASLDAHGISEPHPEGRGAWQAMQRALDDAGIGPDAVDAVNAHGSAHPLKNDVMETVALKRLLGSRAASVPISANKSMIGHLIAAAGAVEAIAAIATMRAGWVSPTINLDNPDAACDLDYVPHRARAIGSDSCCRIRLALAAKNASLLIGAGELLDE